ncbi:MAG: hypothetical protein ACOVLE_10465 [Pirellula staleyi]
MTTFFVTLSYAKLPKVWGGTCRGIRCAIPDGSPHLLKIGATRTLQNK